jgi:hypothetical protein
MMVYLNSSFANINSRSIGRASIIQSTLLLQFSLINTTQQKKSKTNFNDCYVCEKISHKATKSDLVM